MNKAAIEQPLALINPDASLIKLRRKAAIALLVVGPLLLLLGIFVVAVDANNAYEKSTLYDMPIQMWFSSGRIFSPRPPPPPPSDFEVAYKTLNAMLHSDVTGIGVEMIALATIFMLVSGGVRRGVYGASCGALWSFLPVAVGLSLVTAGCILVDLNICLAERNFGLYVWIFIGAAITGVLLTILAWCMFQLLRRVARNPAVEPDKRQFAAKGLRVLGWLLITIGSYLVLSLGHDAGLDLELFSRGYEVTRRNILELFNDAEIYIALACIGWGVAYQLLRRSVLRGKIAATRVTLWTVRLLVAGTLLAIPWGLYLGMFGFEYRYRQNFLYSHAFSAAFMGMVLILAVWDIQAMLRWAMRNPIANVPQPAPVDEIQPLRTNLESTLSVEMPRTLALSYFSRPTTTGQTRRIAAGVLLVLGWPLLLIGGLLLLDSIGLAFDQWGWDAASLHYVLDDLFDNTWVYVWLGSLTAGAIYVICGFAILRRAYGFTHLAIWSFFPIVATCCIFSAVCLEEAISVPLGLWVVRDISFLWFVLPGLFGILLTLLAWDVLTILRWVVRHPSGEINRRMFRPEVQTRSALLP